MVWPVASVAVDCDPYWDNVVLNAASAVYTDATRVSTTGHTAADFCPSKFTIDGYITPTNVGMGPFTGDIYLWNISPADFPNFVFFTIQPDGDITAFINGMTIGNVAAGLISNGVTSHIEIDVDGANAWLYVDGNLIDSSSAIPTDVRTGDVTIHRNGLFNLSGNLYAGWQTAFRVTKNINRNPCGIDFTPPPAPFAEVACYAADTSWVSSTLAVANNARGIGTNGSVFAVAHQTGSGECSVGSPTSWSSVGLGASIYWRDIAASGSTLCAIGVPSSGIGTYSSISTDNGANWTTAADLPVSASWVSIAGSPTAFVAVGDSNLARRLTAGSWASVSSTHVNAAWYSITYADGKFIAVAPAPSAVTQAYIAVSTDDGVTFTDSSFGSIDIRGVGYNGAVWCVVATNGAIYTSPTGLAGSWTEQRAADGTLTYSVAALDGVFYSPVYNSDQCLYSVDDGVTWLSFTLPVSGSWIDCCSDGTRVVAISGSTAVSTKICTDCDPYWGNVVLAMHFDGTEYHASGYIGDPWYTTKADACSLGAVVAYAGSKYGRHNVGEDTCEVFNDAGYTSILTTWTYATRNSLVDEKGHTITLLGTCFTVDNPTLFGGCLGFSGAGDKIGINHVDFVLGTGDFTLDFWVYVTSYTGDKRLGIDNTSGSWLCEIISGSGKIHLRAPGGAYTTTSPNAVPLNQWAHIRISRAAGVAYTFIDGVLQTSDAYAYDLNNSNFVIINAQTSAWFVDEIELTKGIARSTTNFTPPTVPFAEVAC